VSAAVAEPIILYWTPFGVADATRAASEPQCHSTSKKRPFGFQDNRCPRPDFAPIIFENAIRSLQPNSTHRGRTQDAAWLQVVFRVLAEACPIEPWKIKNEAVDKMMKMCLEHKIPLDLDLLRSITLECGLHGEDTDEEIIATVISLDGHVFTIPNAEEKDILNELFSRITVLSATPEWPVVADTYVDRILLPLMGAFAKARDLTGFIHHWYEQLVAFNAIISKRKSKDKLAHFGAWEDDALLDKLRGIMEASLTSEQITSILDWIREQTDSPGPALVVMDAITGALTREETIDAAELHMWAFAWVTAQENVSERYKHRQSRIMTHMMDIYSREKYEQLWRIQPDITGRMVGIGATLSASPSVAELFRTSASQYDAVSEGLILPLKKMLKDKLKVETVPWFASSRKDKEKQQGRSSIAVELDTPDLLYALAKTILVDYPKFIKYVSC
jgi:nucleolar pre-ribosomal-associated protein 2